MAADLFLGIDVGGTVAKAALYRADGSRVAESSAPIDAVVSASDFSERDMEGLWDAASSAVSHVMRASQASPGAVAAVGVTGFGNGLFLVDEAGHPVGPAIASTDTRAHNIVSDWLRMGLGHTARKRTWQTLWPGQPLALFAWLLRFRPELTERAASILLCKDYIRYRLTGELAAEVTDLSSAGLLNGSSTSYDRTLLEALGVESAIPLLPQRLLLPAEVGGPVSRAGASSTGLAVGTPVVAGMADWLALLLGSGAIASDTLSVVSGTWSLNQRLAGAPVIDDSIFGSMLTFNPDRYVLAENSAAGASNLDWFVRTFMSREAAEAVASGQTIYQACDRAFDETDPHDPAVLFLPFAHGSREAPGAGATFVGFTSWHRLRHALRAVYEGITFEHRLYIERLLTATGPARAVRLAGGVLSSPSWIQLFADILGLEIEVPADRQLGALGAAMTAAVGIGVFPSYEDAVSAMTRVSSVVSPRSDLSELYTRRYGDYRQVRESAIQFWRSQDPNQLVGM